MNRRISLAPLIVAGVAGLTPIDGALAACSQVVARLVVIQGAVQSQGTRGDWRTAANAEELCAGDRVRTLERSRATLQLNDETYLSLDQRTTIVLSGLNARMPSWLDLLKGAIYLRSRTPSSLDVKTPFINAAIKGTEFLVASGEAEGQVTVFEGRVEASNPKGSVTLDSGQTATAQAGQAPVRKLLVTPQDAVQWALYYPPLIDLAALRRASSDPAVKRAAALYLAGDSLGALRELETSGNTHAALRASLLLSLGRLDEAQPLIAQIPKTEQGQALALRSVIALTRDDKDQALRLAEQAAQTQPTSPVPWTALSYARQAQFNLPGALAAAQKANELAPDNGLVQTRLAELLDATGDRHGARKAAQRATELNPNLARGWTLLGFTQLADLERDAAKASFDIALRTDPGDPLAHFGRGLTQIRGGDLEAGTEELEIAASLDPNDSLTRSYVGKAYYEQKRSKPAQGQYDLAKQYDPKDPTPWFYDAIKKQTENRPVEALENLQKAIELNDNRAVYRSRQMLDSDLAARSSAQGRIYNNLGFSQRALLEGWKSVNAVPGDYSSHRFLADSFQNFPGYDAARTSELLQSQLLQPLNVTPVQPSLGEQNLLILRGGGPSQQSFNEFNPLFERNRFALQTSGLAGSFNTLGDEITHSAVFNKLSYSLGQFHYETDGYRRNNDLRQDIYNAFFQLAVAPNLSLQTEFRHKDLSQGDLGQQVIPYGFLDQDGRPLNFDKTYRRTVDLDRVRFGATYEISEQSKFITSSILSDLIQQDFGVANDVHDRDYLLEAQYQGRWDRLNLLLGGSQYQARRHGTDGTVTSAGNYQLTRGYIYTYSHPLDSMIWTVGLGFDNYSSPFEYSRGILNPKLGFIWEVFENTTIRATLFRNGNHTINETASIEPTQVAGFNQLYYDRRGTNFWRYGIGVDQRIRNDLFAGFEASFRELTTNPFSNPTDDNQSWREQSYRAYLNWTPTEQIALSINYRMEKFSTNLEQLDSHRTNFPDTDTHFGGFSARYFHDTGFFIHLDPMVVSQAVTGVDVNAEFEVRSSDTFFLLDSTVGYRLPKRFGIINFQVKNMTDEHFVYQNEWWRMNNREAAPQFYPARTFLGTITLSF